MMPDAAEITELAGVDEATVARPIVASRSDDVRSGRSGTPYARTDWLAQAFGAKRRSARYIVDFVCHAADLIIELDGGQHFESRAREARSRGATRFLSSQGYRVLRFNNDEVMTNRQGVFGDNRCCCRACPLPTPPPQAGEGADRIRLDALGHNRCKGPADEIHPLLAQGASRHRRVGRRDRRQAHHDRARGREPRRQGQAARALHHRARDLGRAASQRRPAARLHGRHRRRRSGAGRVRRAECAQPA